MRDEGWGIRKASAFSIIRRHNLQQHYPVFVFVQNRNHVFFFALSGSPLVGVCVCSVWCVRPEHQLQGQGSWTKSNAIYYRYVLSRKLCIKLSPLTDNRNKSIVFINGAKKKKKQQRILDGKGRRRRLWIGSMHDHEKKKLLVIVYN